MPWGGMLRVVPSAPVLAGALGVAALALAGCAYEVAWVGAEPPAALAPCEDPALLTMGVRAGSFEGARPSAQGVTDRFAAELRRVRLFRGVMYPIPDGIEPSWLIELAASDERVDPDSNFWKAFFANAILPLAFVLKMHEEYTLELRATVTLDRATVRSYVARAPVQKRYQSSAPAARVEAAALELAVDGATRTLLAELERDLPVFIEAERKALSGVQ